MATAIWSSASQNGSDAEYRTWGSGISTALAAVGMVKTADTGQVNWTTVVKPSIATYNAYEVWRFNDSLQATYPLFFRIDYGATSGSQLYPAVGLTVGKGSDGAGVITGEILSRTGCHTANGSGTPGNWYMSSGDGSMLAYAPPSNVNAWAGTSGTNVGGFWIDRHRDAAGAPTGIGLVIANYLSQVSPTVRAIKYAGLAAVSTNYFPAIMPSTTGLGAGGSTPLFPGVVSDSAGDLWQPRAVLVGNINDIGSYSTITVPGFGTYMPIGNFNAHDIGAQVTASRAAIWWQ